MSLFNDYFKAVYVALDATTGLTGIISESLSNADPFPKIWIEDGGADDWSNKDDNGLEAFVNLHVGSQKEGTKEIRGLMDKCHSALHNVDLVLANGQSVLCQFVRHDVVIDSDGITRHGIMRFKLLVSEV
ncbi:MAG TPA: DUF3168 domain-containing protein [Agitococcus sp.]|jgi:hypothetical protein|nr:DUF3168 domain-containing protein [Agitococcus sp.]